MVDIVFEYEDLEIFYNKITHTFEIFIDTNEQVAICHLNIEKIKELIETLKEYISKEVDLK